MANNFKECTRLTPNELYALNNGDLTPEDINKKMIACNKKAKLTNSVAAQEFTRDRMRTKQSQNLDQLFKQINKLKASGALSIYEKQFGPGSLTGTGKLKKAISEAAEYKIEGLLENMGVSMMSSAAPIATMAGSPTDSSGTPTQLCKPGPYKKFCREEKTHQDEG
jgi:hypothetical protein